MRPPGLSISSACCEAVLERAELVVDDDAQGLEDALGGWPWPNCAGVGMARRTVSTRSPERQNGSLARRRTMARAICDA